MMHIYVNLADMRYPFDVYVLTFKSFLVSFEYVHVFQ